MFNRPTDETDMGDAPAEEIDHAAIEDELDALEDEIQDE